MKYFLKKSMVIKSQVLVLFFSTFICTAQQEPSALLNAFDSLVGKENLAINNGTFHLETYLVINEKHRYFINDFVSGNVLYDGDHYYDVMLKYDLFEDYLILKPHSSAGGIGINLIQNKVTSFEIDNRKFVNLNNYLPEDIKDDVSGYFEEFGSHPNLKLYIKYFKKSLAKQNKNTVYYEFTLDHEFLIYHDSEYFEISSRKDITDLFPNKKNEIKGFYEANKKLSEDNPVQFYKSLLSKISSLAEGSK